MREPEAEVLLSLPSPDLPSIHRRRIFFTGFLPVFATEYLRYSMDTVSRDEDNPSMYRSVILHDLGDTNAVALSSTLALRHEDAAASAPHTRGYRGALPSVHLFDYLRVFRTLSIRSPSVVISTSLEGVEEGRCPSRVLVRPISPYDSSSVLTSLLSRIRDMQLLLSIQVPIGQIIQVTKGLPPHWHPLPGTKHLRELDPTLVPCSWHFP